MHLLFINIVKLLLSEDRNNQNLYQLLKSLKTCLDMQNSGSIRGLFFIHFFANLAFPAQWDFLPKFLSLHYYTTLEIFLYPEKPKRSRNYNQFVWSDVFQPKWNDIKKTFKNYQNPVKSYYCVRYFYTVVWTAIDSIAENFVFFSTCTNYKI